MTKAQKLKAVDILHAKAQKAIKAAVRKAILRHEQAGVPAVIWKDGKVVQVTSKSTRARTRKKIKPLVVQIAQIYTDLVKLEKEIPEQEHQAKDQVNALRTKYHEILMAKMREDGVSFSDRFDAMQKAFELIQK